ncbi:MAG TPA: hypothetical protein PLT68_13490 [Actinomycetota bacterium]|nr:hypothetical protein [Actinomycetota bacterium]
MNSSEPTRGIPPLARSIPRGRLLRWRREQLMAAGYDELSAHRLAVNGSVDLHAMLVRKDQRDAAGMPSEVARAAGKGSAGGGRDE